MWRDTCSVLHVIYPHISPTKPIQDLINESFSWNRHKFGSVNSSKDSNNKHHFVPKDSDGRVLNFPWFGAAGGVAFIQELQNPFENSQMSLQAFTMALLCLCDSTAGCWIMFFAQFCEKSPCKEAKHEHDAVRTRRGRKNDYDHAGCPHDITLGATLQICVSIELI